MANSQDKKTEEALPPVRISIIPFVVLIGLMTANLILDTIEVPSEMVLFLSTIVASLVAFFILKIPYKKIEKGMLKSIEYGHARKLDYVAGWGSHCYLDCIWYCADVDLSRPCPYLTKNISDNMLYKLRYCCFMYWFELVDDWYSWPCIDRCWHSDGYKSGTSGGCYYFRGFFW